MGRQLNSNSTVHILIDEVEYNLCQYVTSDTIKPHRSTYRTKFAPIHPIQCTIGLWQVASESIETAIARIITLPH